MVDTPPRRRWFQFGIGTMLLLVTVFAVWLGWEMAFIRERQEWVRLAKDRRMIVKTVAESTKPIPSAAQIPIWRRLLGDQPIVAIRLPSDSSDEDLQQVRALFPETDAAIVKGGGFFGPYKPPETF